MLVRTKDKEGRTEGTEGGKTKNKIKFISECFGIISLISKP